MTRKVGAQPDGSVAVSAAVCCVLKGIPFVGFMPGECVARKVRGKCSLGLGGRGQMAVLSQPFCGQLNPVRGPQRNNAVIEVVAAVMQHARPHAMPGIAVFTLSVS